MNIHTGDDAHILRCKIRHQHTVHGPVYHIHAAYIARPDRHIGTFIPAGGQQAQQIIGIVAEVGIHLEGIVVVVLQTPAEAGEIGGAESHFSFTFDHEQSFGELGLQCFDNSGSAIGRTIVDDQYVEWFA